MHQNRGGTWGTREQREPAWIATGLEIKDSTCIFAQSAWYFFASSRADRISCTSVLGCAAPCAVLGRWPLFWRWSGPFSPPSDAANPIEVAGRALAPAYVIDAEVGRLFHLVSVLWKRHRRGGCQCSLTWARQTGSLESAQSCATLLSQDTHHTCAPLDRRAKTRGVSWQTCKYAIRFASEATRRSSSTEIASSPWNPPPRNRFGQPSEC